MREIWGKYGGDVGEIWLGGGLGVVRVESRYMAVTWRLRGGYMAVR